MIKEYYQIIKKEQIARIENSILHRVEMNQLNQTTFRLYLNGKIGLAKAEGAYDDLELEKTAFQKVKNGPEYQAEPTSNQQIEIVYNYMIAKGSDFVDDMSDFISSLKNLFPTITFSNHIKLIDHIFQLYNNNGVYLSYQDHFLDMSLRYEYSRAGEKKSGCFRFRGRRYEKEAFITYLSTLLQACLRPYLPKPEQPLPIIISTQDRGFFNGLLTMLNGERYVSDSSSFSVMKNHLQFHPSFSFYQSHDPEIHFTPFFDAEAVVNPAFRVPLVQDGKVITPYNNKEIAQKTGLPLTGSSVPVWGEMPILFLKAFDIKSTHQTLAEVLNGMNGILLQQLQYEDDSTQENLKVRAEHVFLTDGTTILGALPPLSVSIPWKNLFSTCFKGVTTEPIIPFSNQFGLVFQSIPCQW